MNEVKVLMTLAGNTLLSNTWKQELIIRDDGVYGETLVTGRRTKMFLPYDRIAQVNIVRKVLTADIEIVNKGGTNNLVIKAVNKDEAESAQRLILDMIDKTANTTIPISVNSQSNSNDIPTQIKKLAELKEAGILTEAEFENKKAELLSRM